MAPNNTSSQPDYSDQIEQLQEQISRAQQALRQIQNATGTGIGNTTPARTKGGIDIPPVSGLTASVAKSVVGSTVIQVTWIDAPPPTGARIDHYEIYVQSAYGAQTKPTQVASSKQSPAVFSFQPSGNVSITVFVQTVLSNGQALSLDRCPTTTVIGSKLAPTVLSLLQGYLTQPIASIGGIVGSNGQWSTSILTASSANGGALLTVDIATVGGANGFGIIHSSDIGLLVTIDGSASVQRVVAAGGGSPDATWLATCLRAATTEGCAYYGIGFATSVSVAIVGSTAINSGSMNCTVNYALHT